ncbi:vomeronasal type-2 receptor 116-like [Dipodomys merriami]|uniref:vomeronasal type-2 receptor 116-like n=1 Tax=Dipodomys merriami TaxID=94247 RepID=UPI003855B527
MFVHLVFCTWMEELRSGEEQNLSCFAGKDKSAHVDGDVMIAMLLPHFHLQVDSSHETSRSSEDFYSLYKNYQVILALAFAVEQINKNPHLLSNVTLGFSVYSIDTRDQRILSSACAWLYGKLATPNYNCVSESKLEVALTGDTGAMSATVGTLLQLYSLPQLTFGPFDLILSDHGRFPSVYQMAPKDTSLALGMVSLMLHFLWTWVGLVISADENGLWMLAALREEMDRNGICSGFEMVLAVNSIRSMSKSLLFLYEIRKSTTNVIVVYGNSGFLKTVVNAETLDNSFLAGKVWLMNSLSLAILRGRHHMAAHFHSRLLFIHHYGDVPAFTTFIQTIYPSKYPEDYLLARLWVMAFNCSLSKSDCVTWQNCPHNASFEWLPAHFLDMTMSEKSHHVYNAVHAVAQALQALFLHHTEGQPKGREEKLIISPSQLHPFLRHLHFETPSGDRVTLDEERRLEAEYDIVNIQDFPSGLENKVKVGTFAPSEPRGQQLSIADAMVAWHTGLAETPQSVCTESCGPGFRKSPREGKASCCFDCAPCPENEISNGTDLAQCVRCAEHQYASPDSIRCLLKAESFLAYEEPLGAALACSALCGSALTAAVLGVFVKHQDTPIVRANNRALSYLLLVSLTCCFLCSLLFLGRPHTASCLLQHSTFAVVFTVAVSTVLAKTLTVVLAFALTAPGRSSRQWLVSRAPNLLIPICTLVQVTLCGLWLGTSPPFVDTDAHSEHGHVIILCNKGSLPAFYCLLGYLGGLALASFTVAFLARNLPDTFNEAKFLSFSMLLFCSVWLSFLPVHHSAKGKAVVALEVSSILASSAGLLGCIFAPKCYIILLRPHRNSLQGLRDRSHSGRNKDKS